MIFGDSIGPKIAIAKHFWSLFLDMLKNKDKKIIQSFFLDLKPETKIRWLKDFINGDIQILIYIDIASMRVNILDIKQIIQ